MSSAFPESTCVGLCIQFVRQRTQTYVNSASPGRRCLAARILVEEGDGVGHLWVINTCCADRPLSVKNPGSFPRLTSVCRCSRSLDCSCRAGWDARRGSGRVLLEAVRGYVNNSGTRHSGRRHFWLYLLCFLLLLLFFFFILYLLPSVIRNTKQKLRNVKLNQTRWRFIVKELTVHVRRKLKKKKKKKKMPETFVSFCPTPVRLFLQTVEFPSNLTE